MAYDNPGQETMDEGMPTMGAPGDMPGAEMPEKMPAGASLTITPQMLPSGMKLNAGDIVEFKVVNVKPDGSATVYYNTDEEASSGEEEGEGEHDEQAERNEWENDFRKEMSPRSNMQPESGNSPGEGSEAY